MQTQYTCLTETPGPLIVVVASSIHTAATDEQMAWTDEHCCHLCCYAVVGHRSGGLLMRGIYLQLVE